MREVIRRERELNEAKPSLIDLGKPRDEKGMDSGHERGRAEKEQGGVCVEGG